MKAKGIEAMTEMLNTLKPAATLAMSAVMGALVVLSAVTMLGSTASSKPAMSASAADVLVGISRFHTTDIRVAPDTRPTER